jgi:hypothetical protein
MSRFTEFLNKLNENDREEGLTFSQALYTGKQFISCKRKNGEEQEFEPKVDNLYELTTLHDYEFNAKSWSAYDNKGEIDHE